jgi:hypothetical protein
MELWRPPTPRQLHRLVEELDDSGLRLDGSQPWHELAIAEISYAMRPVVHERYVPSYGAFIEPTTDPDSWFEHTDLEMQRTELPGADPAAVRRYADGVASWLLRRVDGPNEFVALERPAGSERDVVVMADALGATVVQRHPTGSVRIVGPFGVYRWTGLGWHHEPMVSLWVEAIAPRASSDDTLVLRRMLEFAVHDLGARSIGATLVYNARPGEGAVELRLPEPPRLRITNPLALAPLRHALAQTDGAALFDQAGTLLQIGVRLVSSRGSTRAVDGYRGMRHTSARRYSYDDPDAAVIVISDDGPVTVFRGGDVVGSAMSGSDGDPGAA